MRAFDFHNPTHILFGEGRIKDLHKHVPATAKVLILTGGGSAEKNGTLPEVRAALGSRVHATFSGIEPNPTFETLMQAVEKIRAEGFDYLLAVGGGSVLDGTKFVAAAVGFEGDPWDIMLSRGAKVKAAMPFGAVLTLPATGSEMNSGAVITRKALGAKLVFGSPFTFPAFSVLDPAKTLTLPERQIANGIVDAYVHTLEQYLTYPAGGHLQDRFAEGILLTLLEVGPKTLAAPQDLEVRGSFMWAATLALNGLIGAGVPQDWATHMVGHELTALHGIDHARTLALVMPALLHVRRDSKRAKLLQYGERVFGITEGTEEARITAAIEATRAFFESVGIPTRLSAYDLTADAIPAVLKNLEDHGLVKLGEDGSQTLEVTRTILEAAL